MANDVTLSGPLFDGHAEAAMDNYVVHAQGDVAQTGINRVRAKLPTVLKRDTGRYESMPHTEKQQDDLILTDTPIVYGPWLEGTGSRNSKTRFKGYRTFRFVSETLNADAGDIAQRDLEPYLKELS
jgi:hypothetical protein